MGGEGGLMQFVRDGVICNRLPVYERSSLGLICSEFLINKKKWVIFDLVVMMIEKLFGKS